MVGHAAIGIAGEIGGAIPATPPSLAAHYPPSAKEPVHLFAMLGLQDSLSGIVVDLHEGDDAGARAAFARDVQLLLEELGRALETPAPDQDAVAGFTGRIGRASCSACHLVHVPAAMAQAQGREAAEAGRSAHGRLWRPRRSRRAAG